MDVTGLVIVLLLSFVLLYLFTEHLFIPSLDVISRRLGMSSDISGSTLMAIGSSAPELAVMIVAVARAGHHEVIGVGTIVGSALFNLFVITGVALLFRRRSSLQWQPLVRDLFFYALTVVLLGWAIRRNEFSFPEALTFLIVYVGYLAALKYWKRFFPYEDKERTAEEKDGEPEGVAAFFRRHLPRKPAPLFLLSVIVISLMAWLLVDSAIRLAEVLQVPEFLIAVVVIAVGTSIPDLVSSAVVARQGRPGMAINNAIGSNIFDILIGIGLPLFFHHIFSSGEIGIVYADLKLTLTFLLGSVLLLLAMFLVFQWKMGRVTGIILIGLYILFLVLEIYGKLQL